MNSILMTSDAAACLSPDKDLTGGVVYARDSVPLKVTALIQPVKMKSCMQLIIFVSMHVLTAFRHGPMREV